MAVDPDGQHPASADLDLRVVRYFVAVADAGGIGRAAALLRIAQPSLSRQLSRLETRLGARLLDRSPSGSDLTEAGATFLPRARALLRLAEEAATSIRPDALLRPLRLGTVGELGAARVLQAMRRDHPDLPVSSRHLGPSDGRDALRSGTVDALLTRTPFPVEADDGLTVAVLRDEPRVLLVPVGHRLAGLASVTAEDLGEEPVVRSVDADPVWSAFWRLEPRTAPAGPEVHAFEDKLEVVASGQALAVIPEGDRRSTLRSDVTTVPLAVPPCEVVLVTRAERDPAVARLAASVRAILGDGLPGSHDVAAAPPGQPPTTPQTSV